MSPNLLRLDFARTYRDYPISGTCVKRRKLIALVLCLFALTGFPVLEKPGRHQTLKDRAASRTRGGG
jgi:hypothetical protein